MTSSTGAPHPKERIGRVAFRQNPRTGRQNQRTAGLEGTKESLLQSFIPHMGKRRHQTGKEETLWAIEMVNLPVAHPHLTTRLGMSPSVLWTPPAWGSAQQEHSHLPKTWPGSTRDPRLGLEQTLWAMQAPISVTPSRGTCKPSSPNPSP